MSPSNPSPQHPEKSDQGRDAYLMWNFKSSTGKPGCSPSKFQELFDQVHCRLQYVFSLSSDIWLYAIALSPKSSFKFRVTGINYLCYIYISWDSMAHIGQSLTEKRRFSLHVIFFKR